MRSMGAGSTNQFGATESWQEIRMRSGKLFSPSSRQHAVSGSPRHKVRSAGRTPSSINNLWKDDSKRKTRTIVRARKNVHYPYRTIV